MAPFLRHYDTQVLEENPDDNSLASGEMPELEHPDDDEIPALEHPDPDVVFIDCDNCRSRGNLWSPNDSKIPD